MSQNNIENASRREFLVKTMSVGAGLTLGVYLTGCSREEDTSLEAGPGKAGGEVVAESKFEPNAFIRINSDNSVTVIIKHLEMGQGTHTGLATLVAEELDAAWSQIRVEAAPANPALYNNLFWGPMQGTGGSTAMANSFEQMRKAGAAARHMLVAAAAKKWDVAADEITVRDGVIHHQASNKLSSFAAMAELAAQQPIPQDVFLKDPQEFRLIGQHVPRKDSADKVNGTAIFTHDIKLPGMLTALVSHAPRFGARIKSFDASKAKAVKGVSDVIEIPSGVAVLAKDFWSARKGRDALRIDWDNSNAFKQGSDELLEKYKILADKPGSVARSDGDTKNAFQSAKQTFQAAFEFPFLAHAAMEPMNCVVQLNPNGCELWYGAQTNTMDQVAVAKLLGLKPEQVKINMLYAGGSFGRRANPASDYVLEAVSIAKAINAAAPVKLVWTREDDMQAGYYRPMYYHQLKAALDDDGYPVAWQHRIVGQSILAGTAFESMLVKDGVDQTSVEGASNIPYAIPNLQVELHSPVLPVPVQWWRSVGSSHTAFAVETFIDELAVAASRDPLEFRRALLKGHPRHLGVMELAAERAGWGSPMATGRGRGIAVHESFNSYVAQVVEVTVHDNKSFSVDRVVIAVDCGIAVNPDVIRAQMEGGMGYGLAAALSSKITLIDGGVAQSNFHDYTVLRIDQMPAVEVHIVKSEQPPSGVGEPATPVIAPAVANALYQASGQRLYALPLQLSA